MKLDEKWHKHYERENVYCKSNYDEWAGWAAYYDMVNRRLNIEEGGFHYDDHACVSFHCESFAEADFLLKKLKWVKTI